ncbi:MAG TPA: alpha/beta fold hydrolase, partial [Vineibacter sp.]|nr:alpha/beta fold hydrolase [Vineibacter sp.]
MTATVHTVDVAAGFQPNPVLVKGEGPPLVYLHGLLGQAWDGLLDGLSATRRVYAPAHAGADEPDELRGISGMHDLVLYYDDVLDALGLDRIDLVGHSFGGMVAAEIAAARPDRVRRLVLIDALGLWRDDAPVADFLLVPADRQAALLLGDPATDAVRAHLALPDDPEHRITETLRRTTSMASIAHFLWP